MGLGPPVCLDCDSIMSFRMEYPKWYCETCNNSTENVVKHLWELDTDHQKRLDKKFKPRDKDE